MGKGAAIITAIQHMRGDIGLIQDADLEYDPRDIPRLLQPILDGDADVVYGSRFIGTPRRVLYYWHAVLNYWLTTLSNVTTGLNLTDMETCYKAFRTPVLRSLRLRERRFGFEPEVTAAVARAGVRIYEVPISYHGRTYEQGKKIGWKDGVRALWVITRHALPRAKDREGTSPAPR
jgi:glycosyltransferase involved in cell wall biosynthesis